MKLFVIADDFTGANDTGVQLAKKGAKVDVSFQWDEPSTSKADVLVVNTESRALTPEDAQHRIRTTLAKQSIATDTVLYKKIDSTFRGNVGAEIEQVLQTTQTHVAIVAAAIPVAGRITKQGICYVNDIPLLKTEFATDPKTPIYSSSIKEIIARQTNLPVFEIYAQDISQEQLVPKIQAIAKNGPSIIVLDSASETDLMTIGQSLLNLTVSYVLVGAAGLANALPESLYQKSQRQLPVLAVAGSMSQATRAQIAFVEKEELASVVDIDVQKLISHDQIAYQTMMMDVTEVLSRGQHCILRTSTCDDDRHQIDKMCQRENMNRHQLGNLISQNIGELTKDILQSNRIGGLFLTGGDIAIAVAQALGANGYRIVSEVAPCIPCGTLLNSDIEDLPVITKAGGFGSETALRDSLYFIEEMYRQS